MTPPPPRPHSPATPDTGRDVPLTPAEAATLMGVTEDDVLSRQHRGELPELLWYEQLRGDAALDDS
jgi:hypothetical protein